MCDTFIASAAVTKNKQSILAKNSNRPPNEAQQLIRIPPMKHNPGDQVQCTYIQIPQVKETQAVILSQPFWMWGAEMGVNEAGVAIGNEAIFSKVAANKEPALLGMDLLRLGLERATNSKEAVEVIIELLEQYGQGGKCFHKSEIYYHNSFLIADSQEVWVLETIDRDWVARQVEGIYSISNILTLNNQSDIASAGFDRYAQKSEAQVELSREYSDFLYTTFSNARQRCELTRSQLIKHIGTIEISTAAAILRDLENHPDPSKSLSKSNVCMHAGFGPIKISQTTGSLIAVLGGEHPLVLTTGTAAPCTGVFKPVWVDIPLPDMGPDPTETFNPDTLFWSHELLHRAVLQNFNQRLDAYSAERDTLENDFIQGALQRSTASSEERSNYAAQCFEQAAIAERRWLNRVLSIPERTSITQFLQNIAWNRFNNDSQLTMDGSGNTSILD